MVERPRFTPEPRGTARMRQGAEKFVYGVLLTGANQIEGVVKVGAVGAVIGGGLGLIGGDTWKGIKDGFKTGAAIGEWWKWHTTPLEFNRDAAKDGALPVKWYDWGIAAYNRMRIEGNDRPYEFTTSREAFVYKELLNPVSTSALKDIAVGAFQAVFG